MPTLPTLHCSLLQFVVSNAGCRAKDSQLMEDRAGEIRAAGGDTVVEPVMDRGLVAVQVSHMYCNYLHIAFCMQGPAAVNSCLAPLCPGLDLTKLGFMRSVETTVAGIPGCRVRTAHSRQLQ